MQTYVVLMRGINVGGKNKVQMAKLRSFLEELGFSDVITYIQSGNVILRSTLTAHNISDKIEKALPKQFTLDSSIIKVLAIDHRHYEKIVANSPSEFGKDSDTYRYSVVFLMKSSVESALEQITARKGVDDIWEGEGVIYFRNLISHASKSHLSRITQKPVYQSLTIRNWNTTSKLLTLCKSYR